MPGVAKDKYPEEDKKIEWLVARSGEEEELVGLAGGVTILVSARFQMTRKIIEAADGLRFIQQCGAGYDNIDFEAARKKNVVVSNAGTAGTISVPEHTLLLMLALAKSLPKAHNSMAAGEWLLGEMVCNIYELYEKTLGIIGMGKIGTRVAVLANAFEMKVQYYDPYRKETSDLDFSVKTVFLDELLRTSDFISINTALTDETYHMVGEKELRMMKPTAYLINTSRGAVVDEDALARVLEAGVIAGAGLDVFGRHVEAPSKGAKILKLPNVVLTPHLGGSTAEDIFRNFYVTSLGNVMRVVRGENPLYVVGEKAP